MYNPSLRTRFSLVRRFSYSAKWRVIRNASNSTCPLGAMSRLPLLDFSTRPRWSKAAKHTASDTELVDLAATLEPDGGMPGDSPSVRAGRTMAAVLAFVAPGHILTVGAFRLHVTRLVGFLKSVSVGSDMEGRLIAMALDAASTGKVPPGRWLALAVKTVQAGNR
jgi:hypothetical protein